MARKCTIQFGDLDEWELELAKFARSADEMQGFGRAITNAKKECK
jgi:hypothetical protein